MDAMVMGLLFVVLASGKLIRAIIGWSHSAKSIFVCLIHFLVPFRMADHFFLFGKHFRFAHWDRAMKVFAVIHVFAII